MIFCFGGNKLRVLNHVIFLLSSDEEKGRNWKINYKVSGGSTMNCLITFFTVAIDLVLILGI